MHGGGALWLDSSLFHARFSIFAHGAVKSVCCNINDAMVQSFPWSFVAGLYADERTRRIYSI